MKNMVKPENDNQSDLEEGAAMLGDASLSVEAPSNLEAEKSWVQTHRSEIQCGAALLLCVSLIATATALFGSATSHTPQGTPKAQTAPLGNGTLVYLGNGCFWERQFAYVNVERQWGRTDAQITSQVGYAGGTLSSSDGRVCYHHSGSQENVYSHQGFAEVVAVLLTGTQVEQEAQMSALAVDFFSSFQATSAGMQRPDPMDRGAEYRSLIGLPGGRASRLYHVVEAAKHPRMGLVQGVGSEQDALSTVYVMDSLRFPFYRGEQYHQFHSNFFGASYPESYLDGLWHEMMERGAIAPTGCPTGWHH